MKFRITKEKDYTDVDVKDSKASHREIRKKMKDDESSACNETEAEKENEGSTEQTVTDEPKKSELSEDEIEAVKELVEMLPDIKKLLGSDSKEKKSEKKEKDKEKKDPEDKEDEKDLEGDSEVILENSDNESDETEEGFNEFDMEEDVIENDEDENDVHDSALNPGTIEKKVSDSNKDTISHEEEVAQSWQERYDSLLKK